MAAPYNPPKKGEDFKVMIVLHDYNDRASFKLNPTIAAGDFKISKDGGALANLTNLPTVSPAGSPWVLIELTATEMNADVVAIQCIDQTGSKEWADYAFTIITT